MPSHYHFVHLVFLLSLSYLVYCISVWGSTYPSNLNRIFLQQKKVRGIISKSAFDAHTEPIFKQLKILKLSDIYRSQIGKFMFSFKKGLLPDAFIELFLLTNQIHHYNTKSSFTYYFILLIFLYNKYPTARNTLPKTPIVESFQYRNSECGQFFSI